MAQKLWERRLKAAAQPKKKRARTEKSSTFTPATATAAPPSMEVGLVSGGDGIPPSFPRTEEDSGDFDSPFVPEWGLRSVDSVFGDTSISTDWYQKSPTPFDRSQMAAISDDVLFSKGLQSEAMGHCYVSEAFRRMNAYGPMVMDLRTQLSERDSRLEEFERQFAQMSMENGNLQNQVQTLGEKYQQASEAYQQASQAAASAVDNWKQTPAWKQEQEDYVVNNGDALFLGGWQQCASHVRSLYPSVDPIEIMEPGEKIKYLRRVKKAEALGTSVEDLAADDSAHEYDDDDDDDDAGADELDLSMVMGAQPETLATDLPSTSPN